MRWLVTTWVESWLVHAKFRTTAMNVRMKPLGQLGREQKNAISDERLHLLVLGEVEVATK